MFRLLTSEAPTAIDSLSPLPQAADCPVAQRYRLQLPADIHDTPSHPTVARIALYRNADSGGAIIVLFRSGMVLGLDYANDADLLDEWQSTARHYAKPPRNRLQHGGRWISRS